MSREFELLLCCARTRIGAATRSRALGLIRRKPRWSDFLKLADWHGVKALVFHGLKVLGPDRIPLVVFNQLADAFLENRKRNAYVAGELLRLLTRLGTAGIPAIPYKGPALASLVYGKLTLRQFSDLDILVRKGDVFRAAEILADCGYASKLKMTPSQLSAFVEYHYDAPFWGGPQGGFVELQWRVAPRFFGFNFDPWERLETVSLYGKTARGIPAEELLLVLCFHGCWHLWARLSMISDVAELLRFHPKMDWDRVEGLAARYGGQRLLCLGLHLAHTLLEVPVPDRILTLIRQDSRIGPLAQEAARYLSEAAAPGQWRTALFHIRARERLSDRVRYALDLAVTPTVLDWRWLPLPDLLLPLYYLVRPARFAVRLTASLGSAALSRLVRAPHVGAAPDVGGAQESS